MLVSSICCLRFSGYKSSVGLEQTLLNFVFNIYMISDDSLLTILFNFLSYKIGTENLPLLFEGSYEYFSYISRIHLALNTSSGIVPSQV